MFLSWRASRGDPGIVLASETYMELAEKFMETVGDDHHRQDHVLHLYMFYIGFKLGLTDSDSDYLSDTEVKYLLTRFDQLRQTCSDDSVSCLVMQLWLSLRFVTILEIKKLNFTDTERLVHSFSVLEAKLSVKIRNQSDPLFKFFRYLKSRLTQQRLSEAQKTNDEDRIRSYGQKFIRQNAAIYGARNSLNKARTNILIGTQVFSQTNISTKQSVAANRCFQKARKVFDTRDDLKDTRSVFQLKKRLYVCEKLLKSQQKGPDASYWGNQAVDKFEEAFADVLATPDLTNLDLFEVFLKFESQKQNMGRTSEFCANFLARRPLSSIPAAYSLIFDVIHQICHVKSFAGVSDPRAFLKLFCSLKQLTKCENSKAKHWQSFGPQFFFDLLEANKVEFTKDDFTFMIFDETQAAYRSFKSLTSSESGINQKTVIDMSLLQVYAMSTCDQSIGLFPHIKKLLSDPPFMLSEDNLHHFTNEQILYELWKQKKTKNDQPEGLFTRQYNIIVNLQCLCE